MAVVFVQLRRPLSPTSPLASYLDRAPVPTGHRRNAGREPVAPGDDQTVKPPGPNSVYLYLLCGQLVAPSAGAWIETIPPPHSAAPRGPRLRRWWLPRRPVSLCHDGKRFGGHRACPRRRGPWLCGRASGDHRLRNRAAFWASLRPRRSTCAGAAPFRTRLSLSPSEQDFVLLSQGISEVTGEPWPQEWAQLTPQSGILTRPSLWTGLTGRHPLQEPGQRVRTT